MVNIVRYPRITRFLIKNSRGGFVDVMDRRGKTYRVDTVQSWAKPTEQLISVNGVVMPIRRPNN